MRKAIFKHISLIALVAITLPLASCHSSRDAHKTHTYRPYNERRGGKDFKRDKKLPPSGDGLVSEQWANLDVPLVKGDNRQLYAELKAWLGTPYRYSGHDRTGTDCSGMVMEVYNTVFNLKLERSSARMYERNCTPISRESLQEGDLVFFDTGQAGRISHVGIYLKEGKFVHASSSRGVIVSDMEQNYYRKRFHAAGRPILQIYPNQ